MKLSEEQLSDLRARGAYEFTKAGHTVYMRKPNQGETRAFWMSVDGNKAKQFDACKTIAQACVLHPSLEELEAMFDDCPNLPKYIGAELIAIADKAEELDAKKL